MNIKEGMSDDGSSIGENSEAQEVPKDYADGHNASKDGHNTSKASKKSSKSRRSGLSVKNMDSTKPTAISNTRPPSILRDPTPNIM